MRISRLITLHITVYTQELMTCFFFLHPSLPLTFFGTGELKMNEICQTYVIVFFEETEKKKKRLHPVTSSPKARFTLQVLDNKLLSNTAAL